MRNREDVGKLVRKIREEAKLTQKELADRINLDQTTVGAIELGMAEISYARMEQIMRATGYKISFVTKEGRK